MASQLPELLMLPALYLHAGLDLGAGSSSSDTRAAVLVEDEKAPQLRLRALHVERCGMRAVQMVALHPSGRSAMLCT